MSKVEKLNFEWWTERITLEGAEDTADFGWVETEHLGLPDAGGACLSPDGNVIWVRSTDDPKVELGLDVYDEINEMFEHFGFIILELEEMP